MKHRLFRLRRAALTLTVGVGAVGGIVVGASGIAYADSLASGSTIAATGTIPALPSTGTNTAGNLSVTIAGGSAVSSGDVIDLTLSSTNGTIIWASAGAVSGSGITVTSDTIKDAGAILQIVVGAFSGSAAATVTVTSPTYTTTNATGTVAVVGVLDSSATDIPPGTTPADVIGTFTPTSGVANATLPTPHPDYVLTAQATPTITAGSAEAAGSWTLGIYGAVSGEGWTSGNTITISVDVPTTVTNCTGTVASPEEVGFSGAPTVTGAANGNAATAAPTATVALAQTTACTGTAVDNAIVVTFTNSGALNTLGSASVPDATLTLTGVAFNVTTGTPGGDLPVVATSADGGPIVDGTGTSLATPDHTAYSATFTSCGPSPALVSAVTITSNSPAVVVPADSVDVAISNIVLTESAAGEVTGTVHLALPGGGDIWDVNAKPSATATGGATVGAVTGVNSTTLSFPVTTNSTSAGTFTVSGLAVDSNATSGAVTVTVSFTAGGTAVSPITGTAFTIGATTTIAGQDADGTAVQEMEKEYNPNTGGCPDGTTVNTPTNGGRVAPVILATDSTFPDALAASYLAGYLGTGILLTPTTGLSAETAAAIQAEGITHVYVVGGPDVIPTSIISQIESMDAYECGGQTLLPTVAGTDQPIQVTEIYGPTLYDTAQDIAMYPGNTEVGSATFDGAYGLYNDTTGTSTAAPTVTTNLRTAILATSLSWQDAEAASALAYHNHFPVLITAPGSLSTQAETALLTLDIQQVILMGGPVAIANSVETSVAGLGTGISVLRIAGQDYTDTAQEFADFLVNSNDNNVGEVEGLSWDPGSTIAVARGDFYSDGLAGSDITGNNTIPLLLTENPTTVGTYLTSFLNEAGTTGIDNLKATAGHAYDAISSIDIFGGPEAITPATATSLQTDLNG